MKPDEGGRGRLREATRVRSTPRTARTPSFVGLDLGATELRGVQVQQRTGQVSHAATVPLPAGVISHGHVLDPKALAKSLRTLWRAGRFSTRRVAFALPDTSVLTRQLDLPWMPAEDFRAALRWQVGEALPVDLDTVELDYRSLGTYTAHDQHGQDIAMQHCLLVAASTAAVTEACDALISARLEPVGADVASLALLRLELASYPHEASDGELHALVDIGANDVTVVLHHGGDPRFIRAIPQLAGARVIDDLVARVGISEPEAIELLTLTGLNGPPPVVAPVAESSIFAALAPAAGAAADPRTTMALEAIQPWATALVSSIRDSLDYYQAGSGRAAVHDIRVTGRVAGLSGLVERLSTELRLPVHPLDAAQRLQWGRRPAKSLAPSICLATGLALRGRA